MHQQTERPCNEWERVPPIAHTGVPLLLALSGSLWFALAALTLCCAVSCHFVVTPEPAPVMERAVQDGQSVVTLDWIEDSVAQGKLSSRPRTYQPAVEVLAAEMASASSVRAGAGAGSVFRGWTFALSQSFSVAEVNAMKSTITRHGGEVGLLSLPQVHHLVVRSIRDPPCDAAFDRTRHCSVQPNWIEQCTATGKLCWDRECILPKIAWLPLNEHPTAEEAAKAPTKFADRWWASSKHALEEPPRDLAAEFARIRIEEKKAAAAAAAAAELARSTSEEAGEASSGDSDHTDLFAAVSSSASSREQDYHQGELVPCAEASVPGMLRLLLHDDVICAALGLPYFSIPLIDLITDYLQWRRPRSGTRGYQFMRFWNPKQRTLYGAGVAEAQVQRPLCHRFRSVFPFNSQGSRASPTNSESPDDLYHHLAMAGLAVVGWAAPLHVMDAGTGDSYKKLWARLGEAHVDELRIEDYAQLEKMGVLGERMPIIDEDGLLLFDPAAPPPSEDSTALMPNPACCIPNASVVGDYAVTLSTRLPGSYRYNLQLLKTGALYVTLVLTTTAAGEFLDPATQYFDYEGTSIVEATKAFENRFTSTAAILTSASRNATPLTWKDRAELRKQSEAAATAPPATASDDPRDLLLLTDPLPRKEGDALYTAQYAKFCTRTFVDAASVAPSLPPPDAEENLRAKYAGLFSKIEPFRNGPFFDGAAQPTFGANPAPWQTTGPQQAQAPIAAWKLSPAEVAPLEARAKTYMRRVQRAFRDAPDTVATFLQIIADADSKADDLDGVIARVRSLFTGTPHLLRDFNVYLPESKHIVLDAAEQQRLATQTQEPDSEDDDEDSGSEAEQDGWSSEQEFSESDDEEQEKQPKQPQTAAAEKPAETAVPATGPAAPAVAVAASASSQPPPDLADSLTGQFDRCVLLSPADLSVIATLPADSASLFGAYVGPLVTFTNRHGVKASFTFFFDNNTERKLPVRLAAENEGKVREAVRELCAILGHKQRRKGQSSGSVRPASIPPHCCPRVCRFSLSSALCTKLVTVADPVSGELLMTVRGFLADLARDHDQVAIDMRTQPKGVEPPLIVTLRAQREGKARAFVRALEDKCGHTLVVHPRAGTRSKRQAAATAPTAASSESASSAAASTAGSATHAADAPAVASESASSASTSGSAAASAPTEAVAASSSAIPAPSPAAAVAASSSAPAARVRLVYSPECRTCASQLSRMAIEVAAARKARLLQIAPLAPAAAGAGAWGSAAAALAPFGGFGGPAVPATFGTMTTLGAAAPAPLGFTFGTAAPAAAAVAAVPAFNFPAAPAAAAAPASTGFGFGAPVAAAVGGGGGFNAPAPAVSSAVVAAAGALVLPSSSASSATPASFFRFGLTAHDSSNSSVGSFAGASAASALAPAMDGTGGFKFNGSAASAAKATGFAVRGHKSIKGTGKFQSSLSALSAQFGAAAAAAPAPAANAFGFGAASSSSNAQRPGFAFGFGAAASTEANAAASAPSFGSSSPAKDTASSETDASNAAAGSAASSDSSSAAVAAAAPARDPAA